MPRNALPDATAQELNAGRAFYIEFFLAHTGKPDEQVSYYSEKHQEMRKRKISAQELITWAEAVTRSIKQHPHRWAGWNFCKCFPQMPFEYCRCILVLRKRSVELHFAKTKEIQAKKVVDSKQDPVLVTVGADLNVKNLAVITVRQHDKIIQTVFITVEVCVLLFERLRKVKQEEVAHHIA